jgi:hypothetical protein
LSGSRDDSCVPLPFYLLYYSFGLVAIIINNDMQTFTKFDFLPANVRERSFEVQWHQISIKCVEIRPNSDHLFRPWLLDPFLNSVCHV